MKRCLLLLAFCFAAQGHDIITTAITYDRDISRIVNNHCASCHHPGGMAFSLMTYAEARPWAVAIKEEILRRRMPPWGAIKGFGEFRNDQALTPEEMERIVSWTDGGVPEGEPKDLPEPPKSLEPETFHHPKGELSVSGDFALKSAFLLDGLWPEKIPGKGSFQITAQLPDGSIQPLLWLQDYKAQFGHPFLFQTPLNLPARTVIRGIPPGAKITLLPSQEKAVALATSGFANAQSQTNTAPKMEFDVASIKQNKSDARPVTNFPPGPEDAHIPSGALFSGSGVTLYQYTSLAYDFTVYDYQLLKSQLPGWVLADRFDIQARGSGNPTKAQLRLMMQSLLADRFKLAIHFETREVPVFALVLAKPGKTGPQLHPHSDESPCSTASPCGFDSLPNPPGQFRIGARNVTMGFIANVLATSELGRPVLDQTRLTGNFDFTLEWTPNIPASTDFRPDRSGPTYIEALKEQLGLKLESTRGPIQVPVIDHVERPDEN